VITSTLAGQDHLFTERDDIGDFHLRAEVKISDKGNSGIYFRQRALRPPAKRRRSLVPQDRDQGDEQGRAEKLKGGQERLFVP